MRGFLTADKPLPSTVQLFHGFLTADAPTKKPLPLVAQCGSCQLYKHCKSPKMPVDGKGKRKILVVAEAPGADEDDQNKPLVGQSGQTLWSTLSKFGVARDDCWITNAAICRPEDNKLPPKAVEYCRPNVIKAVQELRPRTIILLGASAIRSILGWLWKEDVGSAERWFGWTIPEQKTNAWIVPTWHPSAFNYMSQDQSGLAKMFFEKHLEAACKLEGRPWQKLPHYDHQVELIYDPEEAAEAVQMLIGNDPVAWDYETTTLKPDGPHAEIYTCSFSNGKQTFAFPWHGRVIDAVKDFLRSNTPKIASNIKFEARFSRALLGVWPKNCSSDTMTDAHVLDNRPTITGIKFLSFAMLGQPAWNEYVEPFLKSPSSNEPNKIKQADLKRVLIYNGMDSLMEWLVASKQKGGFR